ncbi:unnamed protein product [Mytilus edulis]|nr:unnamed protein product [Mytilus edulis]
MVTRIIDKLNDQLKVEESYVVNDRKELCCYRRETLLESLNKLNDQLKKERRLLESLDKLNDQLKSKLCCLEERRLLESLDKLNDQLKVSYDVNDQLKSVEEETVT